MWLCSVRETEGLYSGVEWLNPPEKIRSALETHPKMASFKSTPGEDMAISCRIITRNACRRIIAWCFAMPAAGDITTLLFAKSRIS